MSSADTDKANQLDRIVRLLARKLRLQKSRRLFADLFADGKQEAVQTTICVGKGSWLFGSSNGVRARCPPFIDSGECLLL